MPVLGARVRHAPGRPRKRDSRATQGLRAHGDLAGATKPDRQLFILSLKGDVEHRQDSRGAPDGSAHRNVTAGNPTVEFLWNLVTVRLGSLSGQEGPELHQHLLLFWIGNDGFHSCVSTFYL